VEREREARGEARGVALAADEAHEAAAQLEVEVEDGRRAPRKAAAEFEKEPAAVHVVALRGALVGV